MELDNTGCCLKSQLGKSSSSFIILREKLKFNGSKYGESSVKKVLMEH